MHILISSEILASAHQLIPSGASAVLAALSPLFVDDRHLIEIVLSQVEVLSCLRLHLFSGIVVQRQLLNLETVFVLNFVRHCPVLVLLAPLLLVVVAERDLRVALVWGHLRAVD